MSKFNMRAAVSETQKNVLNVIIFQISYIVPEIADRPMNVQQEILVTMGM